MGPGTATIRLPDDPRLSNHVGSQHAGGLFTAAEAASGGAFISVFADRMAEIRPLARSAGIEYEKLAKGPIDARGRRGAARRAGRRGQGRVLDPGRADRRGRAAGGHRHRRLAHPQDGLSWDRGPGSSRARRGSRSLPPARARPSPTGSTGSCPRPGPGRGRCTASRPGCWPPSTQPSMRRSEAPRGGCWRCPAPGGRACCKRAGPPPRRWNPRGTPARPPRSGAGRPRPSRSPTTPCTRWSCPRARCWSSATCPSTRMASASSRGRRRSGTPPGARARTRCAPSRRRGSTSTATASRSRRPSTAPLRACCPAARC